MYLNLFHYMTYSKSKLIDDQTFSTFWPVFFAASFSKEVKQNICFRINALYIYLLILYNLLWLHIRVGCLLNCHNCHGILNFFRIFNGSWWCDKTIKVLLIPLIHLFSYQNIYEKLSNLKPFTFTFYENLSNLNPFTSTFFKVLTYLTYQIVWTSAPKPLPIFLLFSQLSLEKYLLPLWIEFKEHAQKLKYSKSI